MTGSGSRFLLLLLLLDVDVARAEEPKLELRPLFGAHRREGGLLPVQVTLENPSPRDLRLGLELEQDATGSGDLRHAWLDLDSPARSRKEWLALVPAPGPLSGFSAILRDAHGRPLLERELRVEAISRDTRLVAVIGAETLGLLRLRLADPPSALIATLEQRLPADWVAWDAVHVVVWPDPEPHARFPEESEALLQWVEAGGALVVSLPRGRGPIAGSQLERLLPATADDQVFQAPLELSDGEPVTRTRLQPTRGQIVVGSSNDPLVVVGRAGRGRIAVVAFDVAAPAVAGRAGSAVFWNRVLDALSPLPQPVDPGQHVRGWELEQFFRSVARFPGLAPGGALVMSVLLLGYLIAIGPLDWLLLRRIGHRRWAWATYPAWIALFTGLVLLASLRLREGRPRLRAVIVEDRAGGRACGQIFAAIAAERRNLFELRSPEPSFRIIEARAAEESVEAVPDSLGRTPRLSLGGRAERLRLPLEAWSGARFDARYTHAAAGGVEVERTGTGYRVRSRLPFDLDELSVVEGENWSDAAPLARGKEAVLAAGESLADRFGKLGKGSDGEAVESESPFPGARRVLLGATLEPDQARATARVRSRGSASLHLAADRRQDCLLVLGFARDVPPPIEAGKLASSESLLFYRELLCGDPP